MNEREREVALRRMDLAVKRFYGEAVQIGNHPFIEFAGVMVAYLNSCQRAHAAGIDFSMCNGHSGVHLPMESYEVNYLVEKLSCIFNGRVHAAVDEPQEQPCGQPGTQAQSRSAIGEN